MEPHSQPPAPPTETKWGLGRRSGGRVLESFPGPWHSPPVEKPCSALPAYSGPWSCGHSTPWWQEVPSAPLKGLRRVPTSTASAHTRTTLSFPRQQPQLCWHQQGLRGRVNMSHYCMVGREFICISGCLGLLSCKMGEELEIRSLCTVERCGSNGQMLQETDPRPSARDEMGCPRK